MRNLIVKYLVLSYRVKLFGKKFTFPRAANILIPTMLLLGLALIFNPNYPTPDFFTWVMLIITAVLWTVIIVYLRLFPAKWSELDSVQKWFYGLLIGYGKTNNRFTATEFEQWIDIDDIESNNNSAFHNVKAFLVIPVCVVLFLVIII